MSAWRNYTFTLAFSLAGCGVIMFRYIQIQAPDTGTVPIHSPRKAAGPWDSWVGSPGGGGGGGSGDDGSRQFSLVLEVRVKIKGTGGSPLASSCLPLTLGRGSTSPSEEPALGLQFAKWFSFFFFFSDMLLRCQKIALH